MATTIRTLAVYLEANIKNYQDNLDKAEKQTKRLQTVLTDMSRVASGVVVAGMAAVTGAVAMGISKTREWGEGLDKITDILGGTAEEAAGLAYTFNVAGGDVGQLTQSMALMTRGIKNANGELGPSGIALQALGINALDAQGNIRPAIQLFQEVSDKITAMPEGLDKTSAMMDIFGKSGKEMADVLEVASDGGLAKFTQRAKDAGLALSDEQAFGVVQMNRDLKELDLTFTGIGVTLGMSFIPVIKDLAVQLREKLANPETQARVKEIADRLGTMATDNAPKLIELVDHLLDLIDVLIKIPAPVYQVVGGITALIIVAGPLMQFFTGLSAILTTVAGWFGVTGGAAGLLGTVFTFLATNPIGWLILAIIALGATILIFGKDAWNTLTMISAIIRTELVNAWNYLMETDNRIFAGIIAGIQSVLTWISKLTAGLINIQLPAFLTPGSPTPFEIGLRGISSALQEAANLALPEFQAGLNIGVSPSGMASRELPSLTRNVSAVGSGNGGRNITIPVTLNPAPFSFTNEDEIGRKLEPILRKQLRSLGVI